MSDIFIKVIKDRQMLKRILITVSIVIIYKLMGFIPLPGINMGAVQELLSKIGATQAMMLRGGALNRVTILALGLMPYLSSCIIIQLSGIFIVSLKNNREKITRYTYFATAGLSLLQSFFISRWLESPSSFSGASLVLHPGWGFRLVTVFSLTAAVFLILWLARLINKYGIGNGAAILVLSGLVSSFGSGIFQIKTLIRQHTLEPGQNLFLILIFCALVYIIWRITSATKKIPIKYSNSSVKSAITMRFSWPGKISIVFAQSIILLPATIVTLLPGLDKLSTQFSRGGLLYYIVYFILIIFFTYFYIGVVCNPKDINNMMRKYKCDVEDKKGKGTTAYLDGLMNKIAIITGAFLIVASVLPDIYTRVYKLPYLIAGFMGGVSLFVMIGVFYDIKSQIESYFQRKEHPQGNKWEIAYIAFSEVEAEIKKGFLEIKGITCVIEPLRFTWGMPIKTAVDQYRLYVPENSQQKARELLA